MTDIVATDTNGTTAPFITTPGIVLIVMTDIATATLSNDVIGVTDNVVSDINDTTTPAINI